MDGLLLLLLGDTRSMAGQWFWRCFEPLRSDFDRYFWVVLNSPWFGWPDEFDSDREIAPYPRMEKTSVTLWRPGSVGRWADRFGEESIDLWAIDDGYDPPQIAEEFERALFGREEAFIEKHAIVRLIYTDSFCWEIFTNQRPLLAAVRKHLDRAPLIRMFETTSRDREPAHQLAVRELMSQR